MRKRSNGMLLFIILIFGLIGCMIASNVYVVTILGTHLNSQTDLDDYATNINTQTTVLQAKRGYILDRNGNIIAQDNESYTLVAVVKDIRQSQKETAAYVVDQAKTAEMLAPILKAPVAYILDKLTSAASAGKFQTLFGSYGNNLTLAQKKAIDALAMSGLVFQTTITRNYPLGPFASHLIGFSQFVIVTGENGEELEMIGKMGLELIYNESLLGTNGKQEITVDRNGYVLPGSKVIKVDAINGNDVILTLDKSIQETLEATMKQSLAQFSGDQAWGAVMEISTGKVLAWGQAPSFDPNNINITDYTNLGAQYAFEPGSTMKAITYAAAIDAGVYNGSATFDSSSFRMGIKNGLPIRVKVNESAVEVINNSNHKNWGIISFDTGFVYSSNVGIASLLTTSLSADTFKSYIEAFGFLKKVATDGLPETIGQMSFKYPIEKLTPGFGQGVTVTMLQMMQAYSAIFSDGTMIKPYFIEQIRNAYTKEVLYQGSTTVAGSPIKATTAKKMQALMYKVVYDERGTGKNYAIPEVNIIAKTGTAQVAIDGTYSTGKTLFSVMLALPAENPQIMIYYAFQGNYTNRAHIDTAAITQLIRKVALTYNLHKPTDPTVNPVLSQSVISVTIPALVNHTTAYAMQKLLPLKTPILMIGSGTTVIAQYPSADTVALSNQRVFLVCDTSQISMPDMIGWSRKDVQAFLTLTHFTGEISGEGNVVSQSIPVSSILSQEAVIQVTLK